MSKIVDKVFILSCVEDVERRNRLTDFLQRFDLPGVLGISPNDIEYVYTFKNNKIWRQVVDFSNFKNAYYDQFYNSNPDVYCRVFDCFNNIYRTVKLAYLFGYEKILIIEDDTRFHNNFSFLKKCLTSFPKDANIIVGCCRYGEHYSDFDQNAVPQYNGDELYVKIDNNAATCGGGVVYLDKNGMEEYCICAEKHPYHPDRYWDQIKQKDYIKIYRNNVWFADGESNLKKSSIIFL